MAEGKRRLRVSQAELEAVERAHSAARTFEQRSSRRLSWNVYLIGFDAFLGDSLLELKTQAVA